MEIKTISINKSDMIKRLNEELGERQYRYSYVTTIVGWRDTGIGTVVDTHIGFADILTGEKRWLLANKEIIPGGEVILSWDIYYPDNERWEIKLFY